MNHAVDLLLGQQGCLRAGLFFGLRALGCEGSGGLRVPHFLQRLHILRRHHDGRRAPMTRGGDGLALRDVEQLLKTVLDFNGGYCNHGDDLLSLDNWNLTPIGVGFNSYRACSDWDGLTGLFQRLTIGIYLLHVIGDRFLALP